jgi:hypothetical protein
MGGGRFLIAGPDKERRMLTDEERERGGRELKQLEKELGELESKTGDFPNAHMKALLNEVLKALRGQITKKKSELAGSD